LLAKKATLTGEEFSTQKQLGFTTPAHLLLSCQANLSESVRNRAGKSDPIILPQSSQKSSLKLRVS